jgi:hypothetical protein
MTYFNLSPNSSLGFAIHTHTHTPTPSTISCESNTQIKTTTNDKPATPYPYLPLPRFNDFGDNQQKWLLSLPSRPSVPFKSNPTSSPPRRPDPQSAELERAEDGGTRILDWDLKLPRALLRGLILVCLTRFWWFWEGWATNIGKNQAFMKYVGDAHINFGLLIGAELLMGIVQGYRRRR